MTRVIGLSGLAGAGKDFFFEELHRQDKRFKRFALADELKKELRPHILSLYYEDILKCSRVKKNQLRPILVEHGKIRRADSEGKHWTNIVSEQISDFLYLNPNGIACVTDIRYDYYDKDEVFWLKEQMGGTLVHIRKYTEFLGIKEFDTPPNADEAENDPKIRAKADFLVEWPQIIQPDGSNLPILQTYAKSFRQFLHNQNR